jgi:hypothetical protein
MTSDTMDEALEYLSQRGPIYRGYLSNHGPMAAEALVRLGRDDAVMPYLEWYSSRLEGRPSPHGRVDGTNWREMLGQHEEFAAWLRFLEAELAERPWPEVLDTWAARLAPGLRGALLHGLIRTGHAARSLSERETPPRLRELAEGLALWAAWHDELPETSEAGETLPARRAFERLPLLSREQRGDRAAMEERGSVPGFEAVAGMLDVTEPMTALSETTEAYAGLYAGNAALPGNSPIILVHAVTGPSAVRLIAPHVTLETQRRLVRYAWQAAAKINASWNFEGVATPDEDVSIDRDDVIDQAVATRDEHATKLVEACLREHALNPRPVYLAVANDVAERLKS